MKVLPSGIVGFVLGVVVGWLAIPSLTRQRAFRVENEVALVNIDGVETGSLPVGSFVISKRALDPKGELGWQACAPVNFGTELEAARFVVPTDLPVRKIPIVLNAVARDEVVAPKLRRTPPTQ